VALSGISSRRRVIACLALVALGFLVLIGRLGWLQIVRADWLRESAWRYHSRPIPIQADRGEILDRHGYPLVQNVTCESVFANPILVKDKEGAARALAPLLGLSFETTVQRLHQRSYFVWLRRKVKPETAAAVRTLRIRGVGFSPEACRFYPEGGLAAHALGISNIDHEGIEGLELTYNKYLRGTGGAIQVEFDARGQIIEHGIKKVKPAVPGLSLVTTIDRGLQHQCERGLEQTIYETKAARGTIIVMDVSTGEILCLAQYPTFDPHLGGNSDPKARRLWSLADAINPGSTFKPVTAAAALQEGVIDKETTINDTGCFNVQGRTICNWDHRALGAVTIREVMAKSSNVGFATLGMWLGADRFYRYLDAFGITRVTGIDLPGEALGLWIPKKQAVQLDLAIQAFGQTLTVTPIGLLTAINAIANDGTLVRPHLGKQLVDRDGNTVQEVAPRQVNRVLSKENARLLQDLMALVVENGTGRAAAVPGYRVAGKTGTAQKLQGATVVGHTASFVGFAPVPSPRLSVLVMIDEPQGVIYGGQVAAPVFGDLMKDVLMYMAVPPQHLPIRKSEWPGGPVTEIPPPKPVTVPNFVNLPAHAARQLALQSGLDPLLEGEGPLVTGQLPPPGTLLKERDRVLLRTTSPGPGSGTVRVPSLIGLDARQAAERLARVGLPIRLDGSGLVARQDPPAGTSVRSGTPVAVWLARH
jgi:stage V sporulation protein D (sporulation-specific penicillin-binding protein)